MEVMVGPFRYRVRLVHGPIRHEGQTCYGLCDNLQHHILISDLPSEPQRLQVFFHELMHAWWYHFGEQLDNEEATVDLIGLAMTSFTTQLIDYLRSSPSTLDQQRLSNSPRMARHIARHPGARAMTARQRPGAARVSPRTDGGGHHPHAPTIASLPPIAEHADAGWTIRVYDPVA